MEFLKDGERFDDLGGGRLIIQHPDKYCFTSDATALANCVKAGENDIVADLGTGSGIIAILTALQTKAKKVYGVEIQPDAADMATRSVLLNKLERRVEIVNAPMQEAHKILGRESMSVVVVNPPYRKLGTGETSENLSVAISRSERAVTLPEVMESACALLKYGGKFYMAHQSERLVEIFCLMREKNIEPKVLRFLTPQTIIVEGIKGGKGGLLCYI